MPAVPARAGILTPYAQTLINHKARQLCRRRGFCRSDEEDLKQELTLCLLEKQDLYDPQRGASLETFADRVIDSAVKMILRSRRRQKRAAGFEALSLEGSTVLVEGKPAALAEIVDQTDRNRITLTEQGGGSAADQDVRDALRRLPEELTTLARRLQSDTVAAVARQTGRSRQQIYRALAELRRIFQEAGLGPDENRGHFGILRHRSPGHSTTE